MSARDPRDVVLKPVVSEKSYGAQDESIFNVKVRNVNTLNRAGKRKRNRRSGGWGSRPSQKRAIVSLAEGDSIEIFGS
jgi:large subunit ribosomal protein L23